VVDPLETIPHRGGIERHSIFELDDGNAAQGFDATSGLALCDQVTLQLTDLFPRRQMRQGEETAAMN